MDIIEQERALQERRERAILAFYDLPILNIAYSYATDQLRDEYDYYPEGENKLRVGAEILKYATQQRVN